MQKEDIITVQNNGMVLIGTGYTLEQILDALELARRSILSIILRPEEPETKG
jgi:ribose 5-phosphate isomerase